MIIELLKDNCIVANCISKRNEVMLVKDENGDLYILKKMSQIQEQKYELELLQLLHENGVAVPRIIEVWENYILMEYIEGDLLLEVYEKTELLETHAEEKTDNSIGEGLFNCGNKINQEMSSLIIEILFDWLEKFYQATRKYYGKQWILNDVNFRNFIIQEKKIYGIDMELCGPGVIEDDLGKMAAFAENYIPSNTEWKQGFVKLFIDSGIERFHVDRDSVELFYRKELNEIRKRRG